MIKLITAEQLKLAGACASGLRRFRKVFGEEAELTLKNLAKARENELDTGFLANLLPPNKRKAYNEATASAWKAYYKAAASAWKAYDKATALAWKAYDEAIASAEKAYYEATASAWKAYDEATDSALIKAFS